MKILQICHRIPYPSIDGGNIVMMNMAIALADAGHEVHQYALNTKKHFVQPESLPSALRGKLHFESEIIDTRITPGGALKNLFSPGSYNVERFYSRAAEAKLEEILSRQDFDVVQLETLFTTPYISCIRKHSRARIVLRAHNVEHVIWERLASQESNFLKKMYLSFLALRMKKYELQVLEKIDALVPITYVDESLFMKLGYRKPVITLPMSLDITNYPYREDEEAEMCLFHLGSMDWLPNIEAVNWFLDNCWARVHDRYPNLKLFLAGRNFPEDIRRKAHANVIMEGTIGDAMEYMRHKQIMIVPLHSGSGMRVKIIQGMAMGKTIVSTTVGAEGIPVEDEKNILIADTPQHFISVIERCMENPGWCRKIGARGRKFVEEKYSNESIARQLGIFYQAVV